MTDSPAHHMSFASALMELRAPIEALMLVPSLPLLHRLAPKGDGQPVLVIPGFLATDNSTYILRRYLKKQNFNVYSWELGRNPGLRDDIYQKLEQRIIELYGQHQEKVSLVGWSLGGIYARALAHRVPEYIRQVITLGSPFNLPHKAAIDEVEISGPILKLYERLNPGMETDPFVQGDSVWERPPPVPSTSIYSESDGIAAWRYCVDPIAPQTENLRISGSHTGMTHNPLVYYALSDRLAQTPQHWKPFDTSWAHRTLFLKAANPVEPRSEVGDVPLTPKIKPVAANK
jgi:pimeloyl-ACP methyl ester carboxylesterase